MLEPTNKEQQAFCQTILDLSEKHQADFIWCRLKPDALRQLIYAYPSHSFVIDRSEAEQFLFESVRDADEEEMQLALELRNLRQTKDDNDIFISNLTQDCLEKKDEK